MALENISVNVSGNALDYSRVSATGEADTDLGRSIARLKRKTAAYGRLWDYYDGKHPLVFTSEKLKNIFRNAECFSENWCQVVIDAPMDRIALRGLTLSDESLSEQLENLFRATKLNLWSYDIHKAALVCGESTVIAEKFDDDRIRAFYNDPRNVDVVYESDDPMTMKYAVKCWVDGKTVHATVYYHDRFEYYGASKAEVESATSMDAIDRLFKPDSETPSAPNPFGRIPVFHFRRELREVVSELNAGVIRIQDAANKALSDAMVTMEFLGFPQRWAIGNIDLDPERLRPYPGSMTHLPGAVPGEQPVATGTYPPSENTAIINMLDHFVSALTGITGIPKHFFVSTGDAPSGEALITMESPLAKKAQRYIDRFTDVWTDIGVFLMGITGTTVDPSDITVNWDAVQTVPPISLASVRLTNVNAGIPIVNQLRDEGWTMSELDQLREDQLDEKVRTAGATAGPTASPVVQQATRTVVADTATASATPKIEDAISKAIKGGVRKLEAAGTLNG